MNATTINAAFLLISLALVTLWAIGACICAARRHRPEGRG